jgi:hypothetical protein
MRLMGVSRLAGLLALAVTVPLYACEVPDDGGSPLRRLITRVKHLPETEAWLETLPAGSVAQYVLRVDSPQKIRGRCYWPVEVKSNGELWRRFLVSAGGDRIRTP